MHIVKKLVLTAALVAGSSSAFAQGRSSESDQAQGIRQSTLAFTEQTQDRGFLGIRGVFLPVLTGGFIGDTSPGVRAADDRIMTQSIDQRPLPYQRPGSVDNREWLDGQAYRNSSVDEGVWVEGQPRRAGRMMR